MNGYEKLAAKAAVRLLWRHFGNRAVKIDPKGKYWKPLRHAERLGWAWWPADGRCALTPAGVSLATEYVSVGEAAD
jgi:hypothetical protein